MWGATAPLEGYPHTDRFQSTLPVWGATFTKRVWRDTIYISIHAPRVGSDRRQKNASGFLFDFNPRSPCGERQLLIARRRDHDDFNPRSPCGERHENQGGTLWLKSFQSTLPVWGATRILIARLLRFNISIHAPRVGSDQDGPAAQKGVSISIHAPRVGSDWRLWLHHPPRQYFNPRSPCGERRAGRTPQGEDHLYFNPRSPCGERPSLPSLTWVVSLFQSTLPVWGATSKICRKAYPFAENFNPRSPCGERQAEFRIFRNTVPISIHAPRVGSDKRGISWLATLDNFNPRSPCGERPIEKAIRSLK